MSPPETHDPLILVVDDEPPIRRFLSAGLDGQGYRVMGAATAREGLALTASHRPDLVLLDLGLPDGDGLELVRRIREWSRLPIIVLSARGQEQDKIRALDAGADDYMTKPFSMGELRARMRAALRHQSRPADGSGESVIAVADLRVDLGRRIVTVGDRPVRLTPIEYRLLALLARHAGRVLTHAQLLREVWGPAHASEHHYVRVYMAQLRRKIETDPARPRFLITEPGVGYRLRDA